MFTTAIRQAGVVIVVISIAGISAAATTAREKPTKLDRSCISEGCHDRYLEKEFGHGPVLLGDCDGCHEPTDVSKHEFEFVRKGRDLCEFCHLDQAAKKNVHEPLAKGDCLQCHEPHNSDAKGLLKAASLAELCQTCHQVTEGMDFLHGPVAVGQCSICHDPHSSDHAKLLNAAPAEMCFACHVVTKNELAEFEFVHKPARDDCIGCHNPHGASNAQMLKAEPPQLCYPCHEDIQKTAENAKHKHSVVGEKGSCTHCHTPHASTVQFNLTADPMTLCLSCHDKPVGITADEVLKPFTDEIKGKQYPHGPVADKDCKGCHIPHGSEYFRLLAKPYPPQFYAPFEKDTYALCFSCHAETLVLQEQTDTLTDFRNGRQNLHYLHVNKSRRGRTCRACHATHASNLAKHIRESVPYGVWDLPVQFTKTETGGTCAPGCHVPKDYDRQTPVDYSKPKPAAAATGPSGEQS